MNVRFHKGVVTVSARSKWDEARLAAAVLRYGEDSDISLDYRKALESAEMTKLAISPADALGLAAYAEGHDAELTQQLTEAHGEAMAAAHVGTRDSLKGDQ